MNLVLSANALFSGHATVLKAIKQAADLLQPQADGPSLKSLKVNVVVINKLNDEEVPQFVELSKDLPIDVRFIEYMPFDGNKWSGKKLVPSMDLLSQIAASYPSTALQAISPGVSDTARTYRVKDYRGSFGFISSMTDHFCSGCNRLRLGADGSMKVCFRARISSQRPLTWPCCSDMPLRRTKALLTRHYA
jgi:cyclic pyranopterin phosphate synthase